MDAAHRAPTKARQVASGRWPQQHTEALAGAPSPTRGLLPAFMILTQRCWSDVARCLVFAREVRDLDLYMIAHNLKRLPPTWTVSA